MGEAHSGARHGTELPLVLQNKGGRCPPSPFLFVLLPAPTSSYSTTLLLENINRNLKANDNMADENTNPAVEEPKVDETPISHPNAARRNSLEKQLAQRPDRAELVESKHPAGPCPALPCPARCCHPAT